MCPKHPPSRWGFRRLLVAAFCLSIACLAPAVAAEKKDPMPAAAGKSAEFLAERDFDIRQPEQSLAPPAAREPDWWDKALRQRRAAAVETYQAAPAAGMPKGARIVLSEFGLPKMLFHERAALSAPSSRRPAEIARDFLRAHTAIFPFTGADIDGLRLVSEDASDGMVFLNFNQTIDGVDVFLGTVKIVVNSAGQVVQAGVGDVLPQFNLNMEPKLTPEEALKAALEMVGQEPPEKLDRLPADARGRLLFRNPAGTQYNPISMELSVFPMTASSARLAYRMYLDLGGRRAYEILIDAQDGTLLFRHSLVEEIGRGRVWTKSPIAGERELLTFPGGWLALPGTVTVGNNVDAYVDRDGDDMPDTAGATGIRKGRAYSETQNFDFPAGEGTTGQDPRNFRASAVTNLFYFVNRAHDYFYNLGFTETAGNFQNDNFGKGGLGSDAVRAQAQTGYMSNNAGIAVAPEGMRPRIVMGIYTGNTGLPTGDLDSSYAGGVVFHEYAHGVTNRLLGGPDNTSCQVGVQSRALAEGWSDYFASSFFSDPVHGAYVRQNSVRGNRRHSYEGYPFTYEDLGNEGFESHRDGEIWAATLWDLRKQLGQSVADRLVFDGLKFTPCKPSMIQARDAILQSDQQRYGGSHRADIWRVFARHGLGYSAGGANAAVFSAAFDLPPELHPGNRNPGIRSTPPKEIVQLGEHYVYNVEASDPDGDPLRYQLTEGPAGMTIDPSTGRLQWTAGFVGERVKVAVTDGRGGKVIHGFVPPVLTLLRAGQAVTIAGPKGSLGVAGIIVPKNMPVLQVTLRYGGGNANLIVDGPQTGDLAASRRPGTAETISIASPKDGAWIILVQGSDSYSGVSLEAAFPQPRNVNLDSRVTPLSGDQSSERFFRLVVPAGADLLQISTSGGSGDVDLFVRRGRVPVCQYDSDAVTYGVLLGGCVFDRYSAKPGNSDSVVIDSPRAGAWYITLHGYEAYAGVSLAVAYSGSPPAPKPTVSMTATPTQISRGQSATLRWSSTDADSASINQGIGTVPVSGSRVVSPTQTTTYTITVRGSGGTASASATVEVGGGIISQRTWRLSIPGMADPTLHYTSMGAWSFLVPTAATRIQVEMETTSSGVETGLFLRYSTPPRISGGRVLADHRSAARGGTESIVVTPASSPPLRAGRYHFAVGVYTVNREAQVEVTATVYR